MTIILITNIPSSLLIGSLVYILSVFVEVVSAKTLHLISCRKIVSIALSVISLIVFPELLANCLTSP